ncbi:hypothetical protein G3578_09115 [Brevibacillus sp. SYP-B805]|uniref:hypothetical protein n=1 Tax=Brevibacillus sp. SYP-B805 TaxID=1578199 RepID=UPI0013EBCC34|nr:hypothetical protein [Brevibacillus sp. SYP-B805]NGQ95313.1 hypothetical protein [Brevibacillus sp. SYP-B805]
MDAVDLYNNIYSVLANDEDVLNYLGIGASANDLTKEMHLQKRAKPLNIVDHIPLIAFYAPPGGERERGNELVYNTPFRFDIYTNDDVNLAHQIAKRIVALFEGKLMPFQGMENFESKFVTMYESDSGLQNAYCFTVVMQMSVSLDTDDC